MTLPPTPSPTLGEPKSLKMRGFKVSFSKFSGGGSPDPPSYKVVAFMHVALLPLFLLLATTLRTFQAFWSSARQTPVRMRGFKVSFSKFSGGGSPDPPSYKVVAFMHVALLPLFLLLATTLRTFQAFWSSARQTPDRTRAISAQLWGGF